VAVHTKFMMWNLFPCSGTSVLRNLLAPPYTPRMKAIGFSHALLPVYQITQHHIAEDHNIFIIKIQQHCESQFIYLADNRYHWCSI